MKTLFAAADWVAALNPFALAFLTIAVIAALAGLAFLGALIYLSIASGSGEDCPADDEELPPEAFAHRPPTHDEEVRT